VSKEEIIQEAQSLPVDERVVVVDFLLRSLNSPDPAIEEKWAAIAQERLAGVRSGSVQMVSGKQVFAQIQERFPDE